MADALIDDEPMNMIVEIVGMKFYDFQRHKSLKFSPITQNALKISTTPSSTISRSFKPFKISSIWFTVFEVLNEFRISELKV
jgi:hypothetical protein